jgi:hypothetical protein
MSPEPKPGPGPGPIYTETQHFAPALRWAVVVSMVAIAAASYYIIFNLVGDAPTPAEAIFAIAFTVVFPLVISAIFFIARLETEVRSEGLFIRFFPFHLKQRQIKTAGLSECFARSYAPLREYGGWGIRWGRNGRAYSMSGKRGVQLVYDREERVLIGSKRAEELEAAIKGVCPT